MKSPAIFKSLSKKGLFYIDFCGGPLKIFFSNAMKSTFQIFLWTTIFKRLRNNAICYPL